ncbi:MAG: RHS repeat protein [Deltaproteobacteria bacterium]|nr:RHS repeat protein [Deltaproteobacteria bacterium]
MMQANLGYIFTSMAGAPGTYQNLVYDYDQTGNITATTDNIFTASRTFAYDALNRLTSASGNLGTNQAIRISLTHTFCFSGLASDIRGLRPLKCFDSYFHDLQTSTGDFQTIYTTFSPLARRLFMR